MIQIIYKFILSLNVRITLHSLKHTLLNHPKYPHLSSISDSLKIWNIENYFINIHPNSIENLPTPALAVLKSNNASMVIIQNINEGVVKWWHYAEGTQSESITNFSEKCTGIFLIAFPKTYNNKQNIINFKLIVQISLMLILASAITYCILILFKNTQLWAYPALFLTKILGLGISILLIDNEYNKRNSIIESLCSVEKNDCNKLLKSRDAKLFNFISWSELGFFYFAGGVISMILGIGQNLSTALFFLTLINIPTLIFSFYSVWFQYFKAQTWCRFCLITIGLFWVEAILLWNTPSVFPLNNIIQDIFPIVIGFSVPIIALLLVKPLLEKVEESEKVKKELNKIKYNDDVIDALFQKSELKTFPQDCALTINGEIDSPNVLTIVTNPTCPPCAKAHKELKKYFNGCYDDLCVNLIFTIDPERDKDSEKFKIAEKIFQIYQSKGTENALKATNDWYKEKDYEKWDKLYPAENIDVTTVLKMQHEWCKANNIRYTPTILFNNRELPKEYKIEDIRYLMV